MNDVNDSVREIREIGARTIAALDGIASTMKDLATQGSLDPNWVQRERGRLRYRQRYLRRAARTVPASQK